MFGIQTLNFLLLDFRGNYSLIDLRFTFLTFRRSLLFFKLAIHQRGQLLVITNPKFYEKFRETAYSRSITITNGWVTGGLTNYRNVFGYYKSKGKKFGHMFGYPDIVSMFELNSKCDFIRNETRRLSLPLISLVDSDMVFSKSLYGIISNNDSFSFIKHCFRVMITAFDFELDSICCHFSSSRKIFFNRSRKLIKKWHFKPIKRLLSKKKKFIKKLFTIGLEPIPIINRSDFKSDASTKFRQVKNRIKKILKPKYKSYNKAKIKLLKRKNRLLMKIYKRLIAHPYLRALLTSKMIVSRV